MISYATCSYASSDITIDYYPIDGENYTLIKKSNIECMAEETIKLDTPGRISQFWKIIRNGKKHSFDDVSVRAKIVTDKGIYYLDTYGVISFGKRSYQIDRDAFKKYIESSSLKRTKHEAKPCGE